MPLVPGIQPLVNQLLQALSDLLRTDASRDILKTTWSRFQALVTPPQGIYEVLNLDMCLELKDIQGKKAVLTKRQRVRFLQDYVIAFADQAWGDGEIFADYRCSPGVAVDRYREGYKYRVLISLRDTKNRGDTQEIFIERTIRNGFTKKTEDFQLQVEHPTRRACLTVIFPPERPPRHVRLIEQDTRRVSPLNMSDTQRLPDGRWQIKWERSKVRQFETYILEWEW